MTPPATSAARQTLRACTGFVFTLLNAPWFQDSKTSSTSERFLCMWFHHRHFSVHSSRVWHQVFWHWQLIWVPTIVIIGVSPSPIGPSVENLARIDNDHLQRILSPLCGRILFGTFVEVYLPAQAHRWEISYERQICWREGFSESLGNRKTFISRSVGSPWFQNNLTAYLPGLWWSRYHRLPNCCLLL